jgi:hypothetical protein
MANKKKKALCVRKTRQDTCEKWGGTPSELPISILPSYSDIARYYYHVQNQSNPVDLVTNGLIARWQQACPSLPLRPIKNIRCKVNRLKILVVDRNANKVKGAEKRANMDKEKDFLFDIAECKCDLPVLPCADRQIKCKEANCTKEHIYCTCNIAKELKVTYQG